MRIINRIALIIIKGYRLMISPLKPRTCRFYPTCSEYAYQAFFRYNFIKAFSLSVTRILKCHPFHPGGYDPLK